MKSRSHHRRRGMTLIEVATSFALLAVLLTGAFGVFLSSRRSTSEARQEALARIALEHQIERMRTLANTNEASFAALATILTNNSTFTVQGLPPYDPTGAAVVPNGRIRVCLDETKQFFVGADDPYFAAAPFSSEPFPAFNRDLDSSLRTTGVEFTNLPLTSLYRVLPVRVEIGWGRGSAAQRLAPQIRVNAVIAPRTKFRRG